jgi:hypothetical protein
MRLLVCPYISAFAHLLQAKVQFPKLARRISTSIVLVTALLAGIIAPIVLSSCGQEHDDRRLYLVVEHLKNKDPLLVYRRFRDKGRMTPEGLLYVSGWVDDKHEIYQLMETADPKLFDSWMANWNDLIDFELYPLRNFGESLTGIRICAMGSHQLGLTLRMCRRVILHWRMRCPRVLTRRIRVKINSFEPAPQTRVLS